MLLWRKLAMYLGFPLAIGAAIYTAYLFGQAEGRDFWQSPLLPFHFLVQAIMAGGAALTILSALTPIEEGFAKLSFHAFTISLTLNLLMILLGEFGSKHSTDTARAAAHMITQGKYKNLFWFGAIGLGAFFPIGLIYAGLAPLAALSTLIGLYCYEHAFVMAPQHIPNS